MKINKTIVIPIVFFLIGIGLMFAYNQGTKWVDKQIIGFHNGGIVKNTNQFYEQAITGELRIRNFILDENGKIIKENGRPKMGELIILIIEKE